jgi:hypothetical protein
MRPWPSAAIHSGPRLLRRHRRALRGCLWPSAGWIGSHAAARCSPRSECHLRPVNACYPGRAEADGWAAPENPCCRCARRSHRPKHLRGIVPARCPSKRLSSAIRERLPGRMGSRSAPTESLTDLLVIVVFQGLMPRVRGRVSAVRNSSEGRSSRFSTGLEGPRNELSVGLRLHRVNAPEQQPIPRPLPMEADQGISPTQLPGTRLQVRVTGVENCFEPRARSEGASVGPTDARSEALRCFGRSDRRAQGDRCALRSIRPKRAVLHA